jgi:hypothetical protein
VAVASDVPLPGRKIPQLDLNDPAANAGVIDLQRAWSEPDQPSQGEADAGRLGRCAPVHRAGHGPWG